MTFLSALTPRYVLFTCAVAVGALAPATHALAQHPVLFATIPFPFHDSSHNFPAGRYFIKETSENMILIRNMSGDKVGLMMALGQSRNTTSETGKLVFQKYGDEYFLRDIWSANSTTGRQVVMGSAERKLRNAVRSPTAPANQVALNVTP